jgi:hypothetical protein
VPARICGRCEVSLPEDEEYKECPGCGEETKFTIGTKADVDWQARITEIIAEQQAKLGRGDLAILRQRARRLHDAGLDYDRAVELAARRNPLPEQGFTVDVGKFAALVAQGATPDQAARILG